MQGGAVVKFWTQFVVFLVAGAGLVALGGWLSANWIDHEIWGEMVKHVGVGVFVAAFVALFLEIHSVEKHISKFASVVFTQDGYLDQLKPERLFELRRRITKVVLKAVIENRKYDYAALDEEFESLLFGKLMPRKGETGHGREYRTGYEETIELRFMTAEQLARSYGGLPERVESAKGRLYVEVTSTRSCTITSPWLKNKPYSITASGKLEKIDFITNPKTQIQFMMGKAKGALKKVEPEFAGNDPIEYRVSESVEYDEDGTVEVHTRQVELEDADGATQMLMRMNMPTQAPTFILSTNIPIKNLEVNTMGLGEEVRSAEGQRTMKVKYKGWMVRFHGLVISWSPSAVRSALAAQEATVVAARAP